MKKIVIFASGSGTNAENIIRYFQSNLLAEVICIYCNNPKAGIIERAKNLKVKIRLFNREEFSKSNIILEELKASNPDLIVLAGFLWLIPASFAHNFENKIINIHPALLPNYGGKGMYGHFVHEAVIKNQEKESGISIHYVNEHYDEGGIIAQFKTSIAENDTPESLAKKIHLLEYEHFPKVIEQLITQ